MAAKLASFLFSMHRDKKKKTRKRSPWGEKFCKLVNQHKSLQSLKMLSEESDVLTLLISDYRRLNLYATDQRHWKVPLVAGIAQEWSKL